MSGARRQHGNDGSWIKTAGLLAVGAAAGAALAYFTGAVNEPETHQHRSSPRQTAPRPQQTNSTDETDKDEKLDGTIKLCEICFLDFDEIKGMGGQIMATPCGHVYCRICIIQSLEVKRECPHCRQACNINQLQRLYL